MARKAFFCRPQRGICYNHTPIPLFSVSGTSLAHCIGMDAHVGERGNLHTLSRLRTGRFL
jgi:hypothetical protein